MKKTALYSGLLSLGLFASHAFAGLKCTNQEIKDLIMGNLFPRGCFVEFTKNDGAKFITKSKPTGLKKFECTETFNGDKVVTEAQLKLAPEQLPNEQEVSVLVTGGIDDLQMTVKLGPGYEWTEKGFHCESTPDLE